MCPVYTYCSRNNAQMQVFLQKRLPCHLQRGDSGDKTQGAPRIFRGAPWVGSARMMLRRDQKSLLNQRSNESSFGLLEEAESNLKSLSNASELRISLG